jgi:hypothetical protein
MFKVKSYLMILLFLLFTASPSLGEGPSKEELAKQAQNPVASLALWHH